MVCPRCAPEIGGHNANVGGTLTKLVRDPNFKTLSAPMMHTDGCLTKDMKQYYSEEMCT